MRSLLHRRPWEHRGVDCDSRPRTPRRPTRLLLLRTPVGPTSSGRTGERRRTGRACHRWSPTGRSFAHPTNSSWLLPDTGCIPSGSKWLYRQETHTSDFDTRGPGAAPGRQRSTPTSRSPGSPLRPRRRCLERNLAAYCWPRHRTNPGKPPGIQMGPTALGFGRLGIQSHLVLQGPLLGPRSSRQATRPPSWRLPYPVHEVPTGSRVGSPGCAAVSRTESQTAEPAAWTLRRSCRRGKPWRKPAPDSAHG